ncbi:MAG: membrane fusion protein (multidrug efflux system) [Paracoccaceae bacterium]
MASNQWRQISGVKSVASNQWRQISGVKSVASNQWRQINGVVSAPVRDLLMKLSVQVTITILIAAVAGGGWFWLGANQDAEGSRDAKPRRGGATQVLVEKVTFAEDRVVVRAVGTGTALNSAILHPSVSGEVVDVLFKAEQRVKKGDVLVRLDDDHQRLAVRLAQVGLQKARRDAARVSKLAKSGHASRNSLDTAQTDMETAAVRHAQAKAALADRAIIAPFSGVIGLTDISPGDRVTDDTPIATLDERSAILVDFNLTEDHAVRIRVGDRIAVRPTNDPGREITGTVSAMGSQIDEASRTLRVRAKIPNADDTIRPGTSFSVELTFAGGAYPSVREVAVLWSRDGAYLWRARGGKAEKVFVKLVRRDKGRILVDGKLDMGDTVVVQGVQGLRIGQKLNAMPFAAPGRTDAPAPKGADVKVPKAADPKTAKGRKN